MGKYGNSEEFIGKTTFWMRSRKSVLRLADFRIRLKKSHLFRKNCGNLNWIFDRRRMNWDEQKTLGGLMNWCGRRKGREWTGQILIFSLYFFYPGGMYSSFATSFLIPLYFREIEQVKNDHGDELKRKEDVWKRRMESFEQQNEELLKERSRMVWENFFPYKLCTKMFIRLKLKHFK